METRELVYFSALADELHFGRAAENLGITQPVLSRAVARLERRMGVRLVNRTSRKVELTDAGDTFREECRRLLRRLDAAVRRTRQSAHAAGPAIAVRPGTGSGFLPHVLRRYDGPEPELVFTYDTTGAVRDGTADAALVCLGSEELGGLRAIRTGTEDPVALVPRGHVLAGRDGVVVADLRGESSYRDRCPEAGLDEILDRVALGRLITVVGSTVVDRLPEEVAAVPVTDLPSTTLAFCWSPATRNPHLRTLVRSLAEDALPGSAATA
ncbi:LysR family transcriptional regulator [Streptomyces thermodiastaticus]|nr:LysR family transcriptional regulator [Streptomyces thermodiastaticus]